ncbi:MAG: AAA family ATPase [Candidatus Hydrogenedentes bacterium]|nr:AAA family ATPase [Candidatus Hydrogenedentota bacterium]
MRNRLRRVRIRGLRTIFDSDNVSLGDITVLIGANGAGKSNFVSFFRLVSWMVGSGKLAEYVQLYGPASNLLSDGQDVTRDLSGEIEVETDAGVYEYAFRLTYAAGDRFVYTEERWRFTRSGNAAPEWQERGVGHTESQLLAAAENGDETARVIRNLLQRNIVYQFHNTSDTARIRGKWATNDNRHLKEDAANLATVLLRLREERSEYYHRIVVTIRRILPFFADFEFDPHSRQQILRWSEHFTDRIFDASQAADGMLRVMALCTLLLLPEDELPNTIILDEPELGLHPSAIAILGGLVRSVANDTQVVLATQSPALVDCFEPGDVLIVDRSPAPGDNGRQGRKSSFRRLPLDELDEWLEEYTVSELWGKNVFGGRP